MICDVICYLDVPNSRGLLDHNRWRWTVFWTVHSLVVAAVAGYSVFGAGGGYQKDHSTESSLSGHFRKDRYGCLQSLCRREARDHQARSDGGRYHRALSYASGFDFDVRLRLRFPWL